MTPTPARRPLTAVISQRRHALQLACAALLAGLAPLAPAQDYPSKPVKLVVPYPPGGPTDIVARAGTPAAVVAKLNAELQKALDQPELRQRFAGQGFAAQWSSPAAHGRFLQSEVEKWAKVVQVSGARVD